MPDESVHCCVTSPPYWGLRDYGVDGQIGLEETPDEWCARLVEVFCEVKRVLRVDGTFWVNVGDAYTSGGRVGHGTRVGYKQQTNRGMNGINDPVRPPQPDGLKPKDLIGQPWLLAFALRQDGCADWKAVQTIEKVRNELLDAYDHSPPDRVMAVIERLDAEYREAKGNSWYLRSEIIWDKMNPMPESVTDRPTKAHEQIFLLSKSPRYFYDADALREEYGPDSLARVGRGRSDSHKWANGGPGNSEKVYSRRDERQGRMFGLWSAVGAAD